MRNKREFWIKNSLILSGFTLWCVFHLFSQRVGIEATASIDHFGSLSLSSIANRSTKLGKAIPSKKKIEKEISVIMADPAMGKKWGLSQTDSQKAWRVTKGSKDIVVAVIDTGIDTNHPDLRNNLWVNQGETGLDSQGRDKATNNIDDDKNGYVDDVHGWNFVSNSNDLTDNHGHGTHIAGIIGAEGGNGVGISGVAPNVSIMTLKYFDPKAPGVNNLMNTVKAMEYAIKMKAKIINYSGGGTDPSPEELAVAKKAQQKGILFVAAAGNEQSNSDIHGYYPADYDLPNIVSVTAVDKGKNILPTSNYGQKTVDLAAPGNQIFSTIPTKMGGYGLMTGTSQATAFVTGVAALLMANNPTLSPYAVAKYLNKTGDLDPGLTGKTRYARRLNSYRALTILDEGVSAMGIEATNSHNIDPIDFASDQSESMSLQRSKADNGQIITAFGKNLKQALTSLPEIKTEVAETDQDL